MSARDGIFWLLAGVVIFALTLLLEHFGLYGP